MSNPESIKNSELRTYSNEPVRYRLREGDLVRLNGELFVVESQGICEAMHLVPVQLLKKGRHLELEVQS